MAEKILVVGGGGREHAIIKALKKSPDCGEIWCAPGNGGIAADAECVAINAMNIDGVVDFAKKNAVDLVFVAPDDPLAAGMVDALEKEGIRAFGPRANAAIIESSKVFSKNLMKKYGIPTADYAVFSDPKEVVEYVEKRGKFPVVIKADGLALGKGVIIAQTLPEAEAAVREMMIDGRFGSSGSTVVIEEFLTGPEVSVLAFTDGTTVCPMVSSMDHKRAGDGDTGLNTGGMGTVTPNPYYTPEIARKCMDMIFLPTVRAMKAEGREFRGCLYFGLMLTPRGPRVIEYNCRFGDPETQVVLPLLESDLYTVMRATTEGRLAETEVRFGDRSACCVILASKGYPVKYESGCPITLPETGTDEQIYVAGAKLDGDCLLSAGGRVLGITAVRDTLAGAIDAAYALTDKVDFENGFCRRDIGQRALAAAKSDRQ